MMPGGGDVTTVEMRGASRPRARYPDETGYVERDGVRVFWERYGDGEPTVLFLPTWSIIHSRGWKAQIPYFARHFRVVTFDGRGNGRSDRPSAPEAYATDEFVADALAVMDATGTERAWLVSLSMGAPRALLLGADHPERVRGPGVHRPGGAATAILRASSCARVVHRSAGDIRRLGEVQPALLA